MLPENSLHQPYRSRLVRLGLDEGHTTAPNPQINITASGLTGELVIPSSG
jgi:hypothetical protein